MLVVLDTNVIISALLVDVGKPARVLDMVVKSYFSDGQIRLCCNEIIIAEYMDVVNRPRLASKMVASGAIVTVDLLMDISISFLPISSDIQMPDETDRIFYDTAKGCGAILITGNLKHYPNESWIMNPSDFLEYQALI
ncbi:putative toxin-antitoxin system toxin component, PIN family [Deferribacterales bacterium RsTz2092]|nr:PIN domain-containing protein [Deferribacterales bacterium]